MILSFVPEGSLDDFEVSLSQGKTIVWRNVLQQLWGGAEESAPARVTLPVDGVHSA